MVNVQSFAISPNNKCILANNVPFPKSSRIAPNNTNTSVKPTPIIKPSNAAAAVLFLEANASARPNNAQLVTIKGIKIPKI